MKMGRLYGMFSDFLDFVSAGKQADFLVDYMNTRYRTDVKNEFDKKWQPDNQSKLEALKSNAKVLLKSCRDKAGSTADPEIQAVKINTLKMLRGVVSKDELLKEWDGVNERAYRKAGRDHADNSCKIYLMVKRAGRAEGDEDLMKKIKEHVMQDKYTKTRQQRHDNKDNSKDNNKEDMNKDTTRRTKQEKITTPRTTAKTTTKTTAKATVKTTSKTKRRQLR